jgi:ubiquinone/menaquinone biosynthesis C-methylase UbiE
MRVFILLIISISVFAQSDPWKNVYTESAWRERDVWQKPDEIIRQLNIKIGSQVADIGSHEGYMTFKLAKVVGEAGKVYAVDVDQYKLDKLKQHADERKVKNIETIKGDYDNPKLPSGSLDAVIILDTYHEMDDHDDILNHIKVALKSGGHLVLCEPIDDDRRSSTRAVQEGKHELGMSFAIEDLTKAGFKILFKKDPFVDREKIKGDVMWLLVAVKE